MDSWKLNLQFFFICLSLLHPPLSHWSFLSIFFPCRIFSFPDNAVLSVPFLPDLFYIDLRFLFLFIFSSFFEEYIHFFSFPSYKSFIVALYPVNSLSDIKIPKLHRIILVTPSFPMNFVSLFFITSLPATPLSTLKHIAVNFHRISPTNIFHLSSS